MSIPIVFADFTAKLHCTVLCTRSNACKLVGGVVRRESGHKTGSALQVSTGGLWSGLAVAFLPQYSLRRLMYCINANCQDPPAGAESAVGLMKGECSNIYRYRCSFHCQSCPTGLLIIVVVGVKCITCVLLGAMLRSIY